MKKIAITLMVLVLFLPMFFNSSHQIAVEAIQEKTEQVKTILPTVAATDVTIIDVDSRIAYNLSDFLGTVVLLDQWATWCGPCRDTIPILHDLYRYYTTDMIQIISVDIDNSESDALVSGFRANWDMFWIVGIDYNETVYQEYGTGYVPTFHMIDQAGDIVWSHIGSDMMPGVLDELKKLLPDDTTDPTVSEFTAKKDDTEFSIYTPSVDIYANLTDDRWVNGATLIVETSDETLNFELDVSEENDYFEVLETIELLPTNLFGETHVNFTLEARDMWNNTMQSIVKTITVTEYVDAEFPTIGSVGVDISEVDENTFTAFVYAAISDDLMVLEAVIQLIDANDNIIRTKEFAPFNATHMKATLANLLYVDGQPHDYTVTISVTDIAGKTSDITVDLAEEPLPDDTNTTLTVSLIALFTFGCMVFRKKRR